MANVYTRLYGIPSTGLRFLLSMGRGDDPIWPLCCLVKRFYRELL